jgi:hypothetical protein
MNRKRVELARAWGRGLIAIAVLLIVFAGFLFVAAPAWADPMFAWGSTFVLAFGIGLGGMFFGLVWMWRLYRAPTRYESPTWRYRDRD